MTIPLEKPFIYLEGADSSNTVITFDDHQQTDTSATFTSRPPNIIVRGITFEVLWLLKTDFIFIALFEILKLCKVQVKFVVNDIYRTAYAPEIGLSRIL